MMAIGYCHFSAIKRWAKPSRFDGRTIVTAQGWNLLAIDIMSPRRTHAPLVYLYTLTLCSISPCLPYKRYALLMVSK
jgi:hypothetical protein